MAIVFFFIFKATCPRVLQPKFVMIKNSRFQLGGGYILQAQSTVHIYKEYHSVCPLVGIGTLQPPLSPASVPLPPEPKKAHTRRRVRGWENPNSDDWRKVYHSANSVLAGLFSQRKTILLDKSFYYCV